MMHRCSLLRDLLFSTFVLVPLGAYVIPENQESQSPGNIKERKIRSIQIDNPTDTGGIAETGGDSFSDEITGILEIEGWPAKHIQAKRKKKVHLPDVEEDIVGSCPRKEKMTAPNTAYYTSAEGSFACVWKGSGRPRRDCHLVGLVYGENENCFVKGKDNKAFCTPKTDGVDEVLAHDGEIVESKRRRKREPYIRAYEKGRHKRQIVYPNVNTTRVMNIAIYFDEPYINRLAAFNGYDREKAIKDAKMMAVLVVNEMTYHYQTVKQYNGNLRGKLLDIACKLVLVRLPPTTYDWPFIGLLGNFLNYGPTLPAFGDYAFNTGTTADSGPAHHAILVTGRDLYSPFSGSRVVGVAYLKSVCKQSYRRLRVSICEDLDFDLAGIATHESGHALGASHDNGNTCPAGLYIMSSYVFYPSARSRDTYSLFSSCSVDYFQQHLNHDETDDCLGYVDSIFHRNFCKGPRGFEYSLDAQCEAAFGPGWTECNRNTQVNAHGCWLTNSVQCRPYGGNSCYNLEYVVAGTPCAGDTDSTRDHYCLHGDCVEYEEICADEGPASTTVTVTSTTTSTITTTTPTTTTTTTEPTTTTTITTTTTTEPTTTTTTTPTTTTEPTTTTTQTTSTSPATTTMTPTPTISVQTESPPQCICPTFLKTWCCLVNVSNCC